MKNVTNTSTPTSEEERQRRIEETVANGPVPTEEQIRRFEEAKAQWLNDTEGKTMLDLANEIDNEPMTPALEKFHKKHPI